MGASQSGFIDSVGFDMYSQLLEQAIASKQGRALTRQKVMQRLISILMLIYLVIISKTSVKN